MTKIRFNEIRVFYPEKGTVCDLCEKKAKFVEVCIITAMYYCNYHFEHRHDPDPDEIEEKEYERWAESAN